MRYFKLIVVKYCIIDQSLYWKDLGVFFFNCVEEYEDQIITN